MWIHTLRFKMVCSEEHYEFRPNKNKKNLHITCMVNFHSIKSKASRCIGGMGLVENMIEPPKKKRDTSDENLSHLYYDHDN